MTTDSLEAPMAGKAAKKAPSVSKKPAAVKVSKKKTAPTGSAKKSVAKQSVTTASAAGVPGHIVDWTSGILQSQIGKKKVVMEVVYEFSRNTASTYYWTVQYFITSEDKNLIGSGWHAVSQLFSLAYNFKYTQTSIGTVTKAATLPLSGASATGILFDGTVGSTLDLPIFQIKHATGIRYGGSSGIQIVW
jgi:hypothetical protein